jgi:hypothetical protein
MEAIGQLTGLVGSLNLLQSRMAQGRLDRLDHYINAAATSVNRAAALTHRFLAFARRQPSIRSPSIPIDLSSP